MLTANQTCIYEKQYPAERSKYRTFVLISPLQTVPSLHSSLNNTKPPLCFTDGLEVPRAAVSLLTHPKLCHKKLGDVPASNILGANGSEQTERGFHGVCGAIIIDHPIAV